jgi:hypothetical protein
MSGIINNAIAWARRGWGPTARRRISAQSAYPWSVVQPAPVAFIDGAWTGGTILPTGTSVVYSIFWFLSDVPCSQLLSAHGLSTPGTSLAEMSAAIFGPDCTNTQTAPVGTQFVMQHAAAGAVLGYPARFNVPNYFQRTPNDFVSLQAIANSGVIQGPPAAPATDVDPGWVPVLVPIDAYTEAIKTNNNLINVSGGSLTFQVVGLYRVTFTPPGP